MSGMVYAVLGATGGIGSALARRLAAGGARVAVAGRDRGRLEKIASEVDGEAAVVDARDSAEVDAFIKQTVDAYGRLDGVANCVGSLLLKPAHSTTDEQWRDTIETNLFSSFALLRAASRPMREHGGSVVLCSSAAARVGLANHEAIAAAKAGIIGLTLSAAATYARWRVRVNAVAPGLVRTPMTEGITKNDLSAKASLGLHPLGRLGEPEDIASAIAWLLDAQQSWVTGQVIGVDGGLGNLKVASR